MDFDLFSWAANAQPVLTRSVDGGRFRLLVVGIHYAPETIGAGKYTSEMCEWLAARGHRMRVVTAPPHFPTWKLPPGYRVPWLREEKHNGVHILRCPVWVPQEPRGAARVLHHASFALGAAIGLARSLFWRPHLVIVVAPTLAPAPAAWLYARLIGAKTWLHVQKSVPGAARERESAPPSRSGVASFARRLMMRGFDLVSTVSHRTHEYLRREGVRKERMVLLPNWADVDGIQPLQAPSPYRRELGIPEDAVVALFSGHMGRAQDIDLLVRAVHALAGEKNLYFVFGGEGPARSSLEKRCHGMPNVRVLGLQPAARASEWLGLADIHLLLQRTEAPDPLVPFRLASMLASGSPVLATAPLDSAIAEALVGSGIVTPAGDADAFVGALQKLAQDHALRIRLGAAARGQAERKLGRDAILLRWERAIAQLVHGEVG